MASQTQILLHLVELVGHEHGQRVLLAVDGLLLQLGGYGPRHGRGVGAQQTPQLVVDLRLHDPDLEALDVLDRVDRSGAVGQVAEAVLGKSEALELGLGQGAENLVAQRSVENSMRLLVILEQERELHHPDLGSEHVDRPQGDDAHLHRVHLYLLENLGLAAQRAAVQDGDGYLAARRLLRELLELLGGDVLGRAGRGDHAKRDADAGPGRARTRQAEDEDQKDERAPGQDPGEPRRVFGLHVSS